MIINTVTVIFVPVSPNFGRITKGSSHKYTVAWRVPINPILKNFFIARSFSCSHNWRLLFMEERVSNTQRFNFITSISKTQCYQCSCQQKCQTVPKDEYNVLHVERINHDQGHAGHQDYQIRNAQAIRTLWPIRFYNLWNDAHTHN